MHRPALRSFLILAATTLAAGFLAVHPARTADEGWKPIWDGKTLDGWVHLGPGGFTIENGLLKSHGGMGLLWYTKRKFGTGDTLRVVFKTEKTDFCRQQEAMEKEKMACAWQREQLATDERRLAEKCKSIEAELQSLAGLQAEIEGERAAVKQEGRENASQRARLDEMRASLHHDREEIEGLRQSFDADRGRHENTPNAPAPL